MAGSGSCSASPWRIQTFAADRSLAWRSCGVVPPTAQRAQVGQGPPSRHVLFVLTLRKELTMNRRTLLSLVAVVSLIGLGACAQNGPTSACSWDESTNQSVCPVEQTSTEVQ